MNSYSNINTKSIKKEHIDCDDQLPIEYECYDTDCEIQDDIIEYIDVDSYNMDIIPANISISTMSLACYLGTLFITDNIYKYMILEDDNIVSVKSSKGIRCLNSIKDKFKSTNKNSNKNFYNQNTIIIKIYDDRYLNIKLFKNGSIQMTGCKKLSDANIAVNKLISKLKEKLIVKTEDGFNEITFIENPDELTVTKFKIDLINCNFGVNYLINKENLYNLLTKNNVLCRLSPIHSCVNIKYKIMINENESTCVSIFVFQTGNIIITGAKKAEHIREAYHYIVNFLNQNKMNIMKKEIGKILSAADIKEILES